MTYRVRGRGLRKRSRAASCVLADGPVSSCQKKFDTVTVAPPGAGQVSRSCGFSKSPNGHFAGRLNIRFSDSTEPSKRRSVLGIFTSRGRQSG